MYVRPLYPPEPGPAVRDDAAVGDRLPARDDGFGKGRLSLTGGGEPHPPRHPARGFLAHRPKLCGPQVLLGPSFGNRSTAVQRLGFDGLEFRTLATVAA